MKALAMNTRNSIGSLAVALTLGILGTLAAACSSRSGSGASPNADSARAAAAGTLEGPSQSKATAKASADSGMQTKMNGMPGMSGKNMNGTSGNVAGDTSGTMMSPMMEQMQAHLRKLDGVGGDSLKAMLSMHRSMVANMIAESNDQMRKMNMSATPAWQDSIDSLRQDLVRMPDMTASQLHSFMPEHRARIMRFMEMHRSMMSGMNPGMKL